MEASSVQIRTNVDFGSSACNSFRRRRQIPNRLMFKSSVPRRHGISMRLEGSSMGHSGFEANTAIKYSEIKNGQPTDELVTSNPNIEPMDESPGIDEPKHEEIPIQQKKTAKIHDFCFGIPFGGFVFGGGVVGFLFSRNLTVLSMGFLFGGAIITLSTCSLKVWRQGKSSLPFILGQAAIAAVLLWKNFQTYSLTKKLFPAGFYALFSAAMLCFYFYVLISGGNPPPKKLKTATSSA